MPTYIRNLIPSPSMEGSGWSGPYSSDYAFSGTQSLKLTGTSSTPEVTANTTAGITLEPTHIYYARVYGYQVTKTSGSVGFYWPIAEPNFREGIALGDAGKWNMYSAVNNRTSFSAGSYQFRLDYNNSYVAGTIYFDGAMLVDLTDAFGAGKEPTQAWCDANIPYFEGIRILDIAQGDVLNFAYTGGAQSVTLVPGRYKLEVWGAQGGYRSSTSYGGKGGYSVGELAINEEIEAVIQVGGSGNSDGYNGGGTRTTYKGGGGGTDIRLGTDSLYARVIVAGGGGSDGASNKTGMYGGGTTGGSATQSYGTGGSGGTQTAGGAGGNNNSGSFGQGGEGLTRSSGYGGAGGGGWYGGGGAYPDGSGDDDRGGGGGSGFVWTGSNAPSGYLLTSKHYLTDASTTAGNASFAAPGGGSETGHSGDGYARITVLEIYKLVPDAPENLRQTGKTLDSISLAWNASADATGYKLYRDGALYATLTATSYVDSGMLPDESHVYAVLAYNEHGDGELSQPVTMSSAFAYYKISPVFHSATITPNPVNINVQIKISITVTDELVILEPEYWYTGELYAGEV